MLVLLTRRMEEAFSECCNFSRMTPLPLLITDCTGDLWCVLVATWRQGAEHHETRPHPAHGSGGVVVGRGAWHWLQ